MKGKWVVVVFCGLMVLSAMFSALRRQEVWTGDSERVSIAERGFSPRQRPIQESNPARRFSDAIADAVEKVMPSVVVVRTEAIQEKPLESLFGFPMHGVMILEQLAGEGSGVIIDERGYVLTSHHVVEGAQHIEVVLNDGTKL
ncbi:MAG: hypothetical protein DRP64_11835, partial [Verrucomicrobia bacterium]